MSITPGAVPSPEYLPGRDPLSDAIRLGHVITCEHVVRDDGLYTLGVSANPLAAWVFIHRAGEGRRLDGVDDPRALFAALNSNAGPREPMARLVFEQLLHLHYQREYRQRLQTRQPGAFPDLSEDRRVSAEQLARAAAAAAAEHLQPAEGASVDDELEALWAQPASPSTPAHVSWQDRPYGHLTLAEIVDAPRQSRIEALLADRQASTARAEAQAAGPRAAAGRGPHASALREQLQLLQAAAGHEAAMHEAQREADVLFSRLSTIVRRPGRSSPSSGRPSWWARLRQRRTHPLDPHDDSPTALGRSREQLAIAAVEWLRRARAERTALVAAGFGPRPSHRLEALLQEWQESHQAAVLADQDDAVRLRAGLVVEAVAADAKAAALRDRAGLVEAELAVRAALPEPVAAGEAYERALRAAQSARTTRPATVGARARARYQQRPGQSQGQGPQPGAPL